MPRYGSYTRLTLLSVTIFASVIGAQRQQHFFSLDALETAREQTLPIQYHQPWSILLSQNVITSNCVVLEPPELAQTHKSIHEFGDVLILNKSSPNVLCAECAEKNTLQIIGFDQRSVWMKVSELCSTIDYKYSLETATLAEYEVSKIHYSGDPANRIDFVMMGDGYTKSERKKFLADIKRMTDDLFKGETFKSILPILNVWAVFTPSKESGIGVNGKPKDTVFGLYRDGTELRGIYPTHEDNARKACQATGPYACDFPVIIGNDDYYGGLGGEFVISTSSKTSGTVVIRHELGHNLIPVGEEYDGGYVYSGVNAAHSLPPPWTHWLTNTSAFTIEERNRVLFQEYPWLDLSSGPWRKMFYTTGHDQGWDRIYIQASASGVPERGDLWVGIDGNELDWYPTGNDDRRFLEWHSDKGFAPGFHVIEFRQQTEAKKGRMPRQLCNIEIIEYAPEEEYHLKKGYIGNFPTFDINGRKSFRPTNEGCLMRHMEEKTFCRVCQEGLWTNLLRRLHLIESINLTPRKGKAITITLSLLEFGQLRPSPQKNEKYRISWSKDGVLGTKYDDSVKITLPIDEARGTWTVMVQLLTDEVRKDINRDLQDSTTFVIE